MKTKILYLLIFVFVLSSCSKTVEYTPEFIKENTGRYLYTPDEVVEVYFVENKLFLKWRGKDNIQPIQLGDNAFFVKELNKKMQFVTHPETHVKYFSNIPEKGKSVTFDYIKMVDTVEVPSVYLKNKQYAKALKGYLNIKSEDSTSALINEHVFNKYGYKQLRDKKYDDAIEIFKINVALHPTSDNVYDSLGDAYSKKGDSILAYENYKKALGYNNGNKTAKRFVAAYDKKNN